jgi:hypothetical protein
MTPTLHGMQLQGDALAKTLTYGNGAFILHTDDEPSPSPDYDVLRCFSVEIPAGEPPPAVDRLASPARLCCGPACERCTKIICDDGPPPPTVSPSASMHLKVRKAGTTFGAQLMSIDLPAPAPPIGPVVFSTFIAGATFQSIESRFSELIGPQTNPIVVHLYRVIDPRPTPLHQLHETIIAIPVAGQAL